MIGNVYGRLTVLGVAPREKYQSTKFICKCECGVVKAVRKHPLVAGLTRSCGCYNREIMIGRANNYKHGDSSHNGLVTKEFRVWSNIKYRCFNPKSTQYEYYGKRGITVCDRWRYSYENFLYDMGRAPSKKHSIERIDVNAGYSPENCKWVTQLEQNRNKRNTVKINVNGSEIALAVYCEQNGLDYSAEYHKVWKRRRRDELKEFKQL